MKTARDWKEYYARERTALGTQGLHGCLARATNVEWPVGGALVFPHTRLEATGDLVAAVALAVVRSGCEETLALGVLHGGRVEDAETVRRAREGDAAAREELRRVHGPGVEGDAGRWTEEFSLDGFCALVELAAGWLGKKAPRVICRYPFLVGETPEDLPGMAELREIVARGAAVVATTDPIHHGRGYGDAAERGWPVGSGQAKELAHGAVAAALELLGRADYAGFQRVTTEFRSDFRDTGPTLATLLAEGGGCWCSEIHEVRLVDYASALGAAEPTWVGGALISLG